MAITIPLGASVVTRDGQDVGTVDRVIFDPERGEVKAAVIRKGFFLPRDVEVPLVAMEVDQAGQVRLRYTKDQLDELPNFVESNYTTSAPPGFGTPAPYAAGYIYWPMVPYGAGYGTVPAYPPDNVDPARSEAVRRAMRREDMENAVVGEGSTVITRDGQTVGELDRLIFDADSGEVTDLVVRKGFIFTREERLPAALIERADDGVLYLAADAADLRPA